MSRVELIHAKLASIIQAESSLYEYVSFNIQTNLYIHSLNQDQTNLTELSQAEFTNGLAHLTPLQSHIWPFLAAFTSSPSYFLIILLDHSLNNGWGRVGELKKT
jgi:hypothetical protein